MFPFHALNLPSKTRSTILHWLALCLRSRCTYCIPYCKLHGAVLYFVTEYLYRAEDAQLFSLQSSMDRFSLLVLLICNLASNAAAIPWPERTDSAVHGVVLGSEGQSPRPTQEPLYRGLLKRQASFRTCGYRRGDDSMHFTFSFLLIRKLNKISPFSSL